MDPGHSVRSTGGTCTAVATVLIRPLPTAGVYKRYQTTPTHPKVTHFPNGISSVKLFTSTEYDQMARVSAKDCCSVQTPRLITGCSQLLVFHLDEYAPDHDTLISMSISLRHMLKFSMGINSTSTTISSLRGLHEELRLFAANATPYGERSPVGASFLFFDRGRALLT